LGLSVAAGSLWAIVLVAPLLWVINVGVNVWLPVNQVQRREALYFPVFNNERGTYPEAYRLPLARTGKRPNDLPCRGRGALKAASALSTGRGRDELRRIGRISAVFMRIAFEGQNRGGERR
jgi:hypothetical protein